MALPAKPALILIAGLWLLSAPFPARTAEEAPAPPANRLGVHHLALLGTVSEPRFSPDGKWIAYTVEHDDTESDEPRSRIWMTPAGGGDPIPLTAPDVSSSHPRWSPDGRYLAFLSARNDEPARVWRLARVGGEAVAVTDTPQDVAAFEWSPDAARLVLVLRDPTDAERAAHEGEADESAAAPPHVIDRQQFKMDYTGYLDRRRTHLYVQSADGGEPVQITFGDYDDSEPAWSPDGRRIAFTSNRSDNPDDNYNTDIWVVDADVGQTPAEPVRITQGEGPDELPGWSPDGRLITHITVTDPAAIVYATWHLGVTPAGGGETRVLTEDLGRMVYAPAFAPDGTILFLLEDDGRQPLARIAPDGAGLERVTGGRDVVTAFHTAPDGQIAALVTRPHLPAEVFVLEGDNLTQRSFVNRDVLAPLGLGEVVDVRFESADGTPIQGFIVKPAGFEPGRRYPAVLDIHGGPQMQYDGRFHFEAQLYAAQGWLVVHPNPRGSTGQGQAFSMAIWRDWGGPDFDDVMAAVDDAIDRDWADPDRLGVVGWSYGGILTNHVITKTDRFAAAVSGASEVLYVANYGHDQYQRWWEAELGLPWEPEARERWERISPFNRVERITTPTLIIGGAEDWNVPIINSEQLYLALKKLGVDTQLVVYPGEHHTITRPSYRRDLYRRHLDWLDERL